MNRGSAPGSGMRLLPKILLWAAALLLFAGLVVPLIHANRFHRQIRAALESALGRKVEIGEVTLNLLTGPGFQLQNVVIGEDPAFGIEPFAYMDSMQVRLRLRTLWTGQIQLASLTLINPSINLVKNAGGRWNFEALLDRARAGTAPARQGGGSEAYFPYIGVQSGRLNFKFGDYKSVFYIQDLEAALAPLRDEGDRWRTRFAGTPARTDRTLSGMGRVTGEGDLGAAAGLVRLDLALESSPLEHLLALVYGRDFGIHGEASARAQLSGEMSNVRIQGVLQAGDVHRWDLLPSQESRFAAPFLGQLDLPHQKLEVQTSPSAQIPVRAHFTLQNYLSEPVWNAVLELDRAPAEPFLRTAQHLGAELPGGVEVRGYLSGRAEFHGSLWPRGSLRFENGQVLLQNSRPLAVESAEIRLDGGAFEIPPAPVTLGEEVLQASAAGRLNPLQVEGQLSTQGISVETLREQFSAKRPAWIRSLASGFWEGQIAYRKQGAAAGVLTGSGLLTNARWQPEGLESAIEISRARIRWEPKAVQIDELRGSVGESSFTGSCRSRMAEDGSGAAQNFCAVHFPELDVSELDQWLNPQQKRSRWEIWKRALGRSNGDAAAWLQAARMQGNLTIDTLTAGKWTFRNVRSDVAFGGGSLALNRFRAELGKGLVRGTFRAEFLKPGPRYQLIASVRGIDLKSLSDSAALPANFQRGALDVNLELSTRGRTAAELRAALKGSGAFSGRSITLENVEWNEAAPEADSLEIHSLDGRFELTRNGLNLKDLNMIVGGEKYQGRGSVGGRPAVLLEFASHGRQSRLIGAAMEETVAGTP